MLIYCQRIIIKLMNNYSFSECKTYIHIYLIRFYQILLIFISYFPLANINLNSIRPNILSIIIFYCSIFTKKEILSKEYLLFLITLEYLLVDSAALGKFIYIIYFCAYYFIRRKKNFFLSKSFVSIIACYFLFSFSIEFLYILNSFYHSKSFFFRDFIFILFNNLMLYIIVHSIFTAQEILLDKSRLN